MTLKQNDELVRLKRVEEQFIAFKKYSSNMTYPVTLDECNHKDCEAYEVGDGCRSPSDYYKCKSFEWCSVCEKKFCDSHVRENEFEFYCDNCYLTL